MRTQKKPGDEPGFSLCDDLQTHQLRANRTINHSRMGEQNAIEHAMQMMDRYNRLFQRTLSLAF